MEDIVIYTIGFTKKSAHDFFNLLRSSGVKHLLDIRLNNTSQLAGFTKREDLRYFLKEILNMQYHEIPAFAPSEDMLKEYPKNKDWRRYEISYNALINQRKPETSIPIQLFGEGIVLLCSEPKADRCHRRLAAEYLAKLNSTPVRVVHL